MTDQPTEGKTKRIRGHSNDPHLVDVNSKNAITSGDGAQTDELEGKALCSTRTTSNIFRLLINHGVPTHFVDDGDDPESFIAERVEMYPIEVVVRAEATGSDLERHPDHVEGQKFEELKAEFFFKDDERHDPIMLPVAEGGAQYFDLHDAHAPITPNSFLERIRVPGVSASVLGLLGQNAVWAFTILQRAWKTWEDTSIIDFKVEEGLTTRDGRLVLADVIDNDSWRIWPHGQKKLMLDKQVFRDHGIPDDASRSKMKENFELVAAVTDSFPALYFPDLARAA